MSKEQTPLQSQMRRRFLQRTDDGTEFYAGTIEADSKRSDPESGRGVDKYAETLGWDFVDRAQGGSVLDLGGGKNANLGRSLSRLLRGEVEIHTLSPEYTDEDLTRLSEFRPVRGVAQSLPYPDNSFTVILAQQVHKHFPDRENFLKALQEIGRTLTPGGVAYLGPALPDDEAERLMELEKHKGVNVWHNTILDRSSFEYDDNPPSDEERLQLGFTDKLNIRKETKIKDGYARTVIVVEKLGGQA